jgi:hypothetical protein
MFDEAHQTDNPATGAVVHIGHIHPGTVCMLEHIEPAATSTRHMQVVLVRNEHADKRTIRKSNLSRLSPAFFIYSDRLAIVHIQITSKTAQSQTTRNCCHWNGQPEANIRQDMFCGDELLEDC